VVSSRLVEQTTSSRLFVLVETSSRIFNPPTCRAIRARGRRDVSKQGGDPRLPHLFVPRQHGSRLACDYGRGTDRCGAAEDDPIHNGWKSKSRPPRKGQALVEMAMMMPILLVLILGIAWVGMAQLMALRLAHAAAEGAIAGAVNPGDSCGEAVARARQVYALPLDDATCDVTGQVIEVRLTDTLHFWTPWAATFTLDRAERAVLR
jgi:hypothetical protein